MKYFYAQELARNFACFWRQRAELAADADLQHYSILLGAKRHKSDLEVCLNGRGARSDIRGVLLGQEDQFFDPHTQQLHRAPHTYSDLLFRSVLKDRARSIYTGLIRIEKDAVECDAYQSNRNLLLSDEARADSTPVLEIFPDAVRCKHGATAGPLDPEEIFYLAARGIPESLATEMLILGFFEPILAHIPLPGMAERLTEKVRLSLGLGEI